MRVGKDPGITRRDFLWLVSLSAGGLLAGCAVNPVTGKQQLMLLSENQEIQIDRENSPHQFSADYGMVEDRALNDYIDRTGKGLRSSPRDALLAASVAPAQRGAAFGLHRAMDHAGAVLGPLIAFSILTWWTDDLRTIFWWSAIPGALAVLMILVFVKESTPESPLPEPVLRDAGTNTGSGLATLLLPIGLFTIGNSSDLFLLLKASASRSPMTELPLLWMGLHLVKTIASVPGGRLADTLGRRKVLALGWIYYAAVYTAFAFVDDPRLIWCLFIAYGIHHGLTEGAERALVAELAPASQRGTAFGWFHLTVGIGSLVASVMFGTVWTYAGSRAAFLMSATLAILAAGTLIGLTPPSDGVRQEITGDSDG